MFRVFFTTSSRWKNEIIMHEKAVTKLSPLCFLAREKDALKKIELTNAPPFWKPLGNSSHGLFHKKRSWVRELHAHVSFLPV